MPKTLLLLRHGETDGNRHRVVQTGETPLNQRGLMQAELAAQRIVGEHGTNLVVRASDYQRAHQTAQAVTRRAGLGLTNDPLLRERNLGDLRGRAYDDLGLDPFAPDYHPPAGESWQQFFDRVATLWAAVPRHLADIPDDHALLLVTHGLVLRAVVQNHLGDATSALDETWPNTSLTSLRQTPEGTFKVLRINCAQHLSAGNADTSNDFGIA